MSTTHQEDRTDAPGPQLRQNDKVEELKQQGDIKKDYISLSRHTSTPDSMVAIFETES
jgi:hypothetical protein